MQSQNLICIGLLKAAILVTAFVPVSTHAASLHERKPTDPLRQAVLAILETKCNSCHKKQNPFMVFKSKNVEKKAQKIYQMVFVERRMPKGNVKLTREEYQQLENWLKTQTTD